MSPGKKGKTKMFRKGSIALTFALASMLTAGCHAQQIPPVPVVTAPLVTSVAYTQLNMSTPVSATTYTDQPATGDFCYFVQLLDGTGVSSASNTVCGTTTAALKHVTLSWNAPAGYTCQNACTYVVSRAPAITTPVGSPVLSAPKTVAELSAPAGTTTLAKLVQLRVSVGE